MECFADTSSLVAMCVEMYPFDVFPSLYREFSQIEITVVLFPEVEQEFREIYPRAKKKAQADQAPLEASENDETEDGIDQCYVEGMYPLTWFRRQPCVQSRAPTREEYARREELMGLYVPEPRHQDDEFRVSQVDYLLVASAKLARGFVLSEERRQGQLPANPVNYSIPTLCRLQDVLCHRMINLFRMSSIRV